MFVAVVELCCSVNKNIAPTASPRGDGNLSIKTASNLYKWKVDDRGYKYLYIKASLVNNSESIFYSILGDGFPGGLDQDRLMIASPSSGFIEKFDKRTNSWKVTHFTSAPICGVCFVEIRPSQTYPVSSYLRLIPRKGKGQFRIRIDYFTQLNPSSETVPLKDYSNVFEIR